MSLAPAIIRASRWRRFRARVRAFLHRCTPRLFETDEGIGGRCTSCGAIYGWVTRDELRQYCDGPLATALHRSNWRPPAITDFGEDGP